MTTTKSNFTSNDDVEQTTVAPIRRSDPPIKYPQEYWIIHECLWRAGSSDDCGVAGTSQQGPPPFGAVLTSREEMNAVLAAHCFENGHSVLKVQNNLTDLRDALNKVVTSTETKASLSSPQKDSTITTTQEEMKRFELFRKVIEHEDDLLNQRVSWIILAQSFLMAAFITTNSNDDDNALRYITAMVGLLTVVVTMPAIVAAGRNIEVQQQVYFRGVASDERCHQLHGHDRDCIYRQGESRRRSSEGHLFPNTAYRGKYGVPILHTVMALAVVQFAGWMSLLVTLIMDW